MFRSGRKRQITRWNRVPPFPHPRLPLSSLHSSFFFSPLLIYFSPPPTDNAREITVSVVTMHVWKRNARFLACSRLRDSDEKSFSKKKCEKRAGAGWASYFRLSALYYLRAWHRLLDLTSYGISKSRGRICGGGGRGDINKRQKASPRKK